MRFIETTLAAEAANLEATVRQLADDLGQAFDNNKLTPSQIFPQIAGDALVGIIEGVRRLALGLLDLFKDLLEWFGQCGGAVPVSAAR